MEFLKDYGLFLAEVVTIVLAIGVIIALIASQKQKKAFSGHIEVDKINEKIDAMSTVLKEAICEPEQLKQEKKQQKEAKKTAKKQAKKDNQGNEAPKKRVYLLDFNGDIKASATSHMREEITAILAVATEADEIVLKLESAGGMVHSYGLAASQLARITSRNIPLTVCVDKVAASGGYMMACVANKICAAPFAILGSIGVLAQIPNFNRLLKKHDIDFEQLTAGEYKRTLTIFGENTDAGRQKFVDDLEKTHKLFKDFVKQHRDVVDIDDVSTGEIWFGTEAKEKMLVDELRTSDDYVTKLAIDSDIYQVKYVQKKTIAEKIGMAACAAIDRTLLKVWEDLNLSRFFL